ncbi:PREDICTED: homeobox-leucine zipper protein HDG11-like isoform X2 [Camelina sativa]|uniref:Homeobox-leucine zipper protein HDG11-like isoform X2 n=1 Tax=Camelina sativa TaxID=90675 RepID=A0ABM0VV86_CAMSA|nr:PREDICTED: homeobox-leucine zipper protein HDG11-like isoform X2 [Camelina sativa]
MYVGHNNLQSQPNLAISDMDNPLMTDIALTTLEELLRFLHTNEPLWTKTNGCRDILNLGSDENIFPRSSNRGKNHNFRVQASRSFGIVFMNAMALVYMFMDCVKCAELFPSIIAAYKALAVIFSGMGGIHEGALHLGKWVCWWILWWRWSWRRRCGGFFNGESADLNDHKRLMSVVVGHIVDVSK